MKIQRCLYCYQELEAGEKDFHPSCSRKFFGKSIPPVLHYSDDDILKLAQQVIRSQIAVTGVQPKLSLELERAEAENIPQRFTIVGLWGSYILKPPGNTYPFLAEFEDVTMHLASISGIATVPHSLIRLQSGNLAYITKRIDREKKSKLPMEDMCQLTERLTEHKYRGSYEQIGRAIVKYSAAPGLDIIRFCEQVIFSFLTCNADMHLKNFSLLRDPKLGYTLAPAYDMVPSALIVKGDKEELALTLNGRKQKINQNDFNTLFSLFRITEKAGAGIFNRMKKSIPAWMEFIDKSFLPEDLRKEYKQYIHERSQRLSIRY